MSVTMKQMLIAIMIAFVFAGLGASVYYYSHSGDDEFDMMDDHRNAMRMDGDIDTAIVYDDMNSS